MKLEDLHLNDKLIKKLNENNVHTIEDLIFYSSNLFIGISAVSHVNILRKLVLFLAAQNNNITTNNQDKFIKIPENFEVIVEKANKFDKIKKLIRE